jgi:hypothetical protein
VYVKQYGFFDIPAIKNRAGSSIKSSCVIKLKAMAGIRFSPVEMIRVYLFYQHDQPVRGGE